MVTSVSPLVIFGVLLLRCATETHGWGMEDFPLFDLVEEVEQTFQQKDFYHLFNISQDATLGQIKKSYRNLSRIYHPDKNAEEDASNKFRQIAAVYEILKDEEARKKYNEILEFGLPDWRQPIWYFRRVRKMPWWETLVLIVLIVTVGHYLMLWGAYFERKVTLLEALESRFKRKEKKYKRKYNIDVDDLIDDHLKENLERPRVLQLLPFTTLSFCFHCVISMPSWASTAFTEWKASRNPPPEEEEEEEERKRPAPIRLEHTEYAVATDLKPVSTTNLSPTGDTDSENEGDSANTNMEWTTEDVSFLIKLSSQKFPVGTPNRWEQIASVLKRKPAEITQMIGKLKHIDRQDYEKLANLSTTVELDNEKEKGNQTTRVEPESWSQKDQKLLEKALSQFPKGTEERWEKIASSISGKTKEDCLARFKYLAEVVRNRKTKAAQ